MKLFFSKMTAQDQIPAEQIHAIKTYTTNQFIDKLRQVYKPFPKAIHVFFNIDSMKKSIIDVAFINPVLYVFENGKTKKFVSGKELNEKLRHGILYLNIRKGIENKMKLLKHQSYVIHIDVTQQRHGDYDYYPTTLSYVTDTSLASQIKEAEEELFNVVEFKL
jgi:hypothetical protein